MFEKLNILQDIEVNNALLLRIGIGHPGPPEDRLRIIGLLVWLRDRTIAAPVLAATIRALPLPVLICFVAFRTLPRDTLDAALLDGAGRVARLAVAGGELSATIMVNPPGMTTVPIRVFGLLHAGVRHQVAAISLTGLLAVLLIAALITFLTPRLWSVRTTEIPARMR